MLVCVGPGVRHATKRSLMEKPCALLVSAQLDKFTGMCAGCCCCSLSLADTNNNVQPPISVTCITIHTEIQLRASKN
jgi:hypothetical protein